MSSFLWDMKCAIERFAPMDETEAEYKAQLIELVQMIGKRRREADPSLESLVKTCNANRIPHTDTYVAPSGEIVTPEKMLEVYRMEPRARQRRIADLMGVADVF